MAHALTVTIADFNGALFDPKVSGENYDGKVTNVNLVLFPATWPAVADWAANPVAAGPGTFLWNGVNYVAPVALSHSVPMSEFARINFAYLRVNNISETKACCLVAYRLLAAQLGYIHPSFAVSATDRDVRYNECVTVARDHYIYGDAHYRDFDPRVINRYLTPARLVAMKGAFSDLLGTLAYHFKARGHHWLADSGEAYARVWNAIGRGVFADDATLEEVVTIGLHAILPDVLLKLHAYFVQMNLVSGGIMLRIDTAPAGMAAPRILKRLLDDLLASGLPVPKQMADQLVYLNHVNAAIDSHPCAGWINARYVRAPRVDFKEARVSSAAAAVHGFLTRTTPNHPVLASASLKRMSDAAPITGAVFGAVLKAGLEQHTALMAQRAIMHSEDESKAIAAPPPLTILAPAPVLARPVGGAAAVAERPDEVPAPDLRSRRTDRRGSDPVVTRDVRRSSRELNVFNPLPPPAKAAPVGAVHLPVTGPGGAASSGAGAVREHTGPPFTVEEKRYMQAFLMSDKRAADTQEVLDQQRLEYQRAREFIRRIRDANDGQMTNQIVAEFMNSIDLLANIIEEGALVVSAAR